MKFKLPIIILAAAITAGLASCNSDDDYQMEVIEDTSIGNVEVTSFTLKKASSSGIHFDSVFFSIDLDKAIIFNADSLPVGTSVGNMLAEVELPTVDKAEFVMQYDDQETKTIEYTDNLSDSIDFGADKVLLRVVSYSKKVMREYTVKINVHRMKPDSLAWDESAFAAMPTVVAAPAAQKTVELNGSLYTLSSDGSAASLAVTGNFGDKAWTTSAVSLPAGALVESFSTAGGSFYILDNADNLYKSADARSWTAAGASMCHIYGAYGPTLVGVKKAAGKYYHVTYPSTREVEVAEGCPVAATSALLSYDSKWSDSEMVTFTGGRAADGSLSGATWGYDGSAWTKLSVDAMPAREGIAVCSYYTASVNNYYETSTREVLYAFGGRKADGSVNNTLYISVDRGVHWTKADASFQFSRFAPELYGAQAVVCTSTLYVKDPEAQSRAVKPVTSWECPYIYIIGGHTQSGRFNNSIYRAVLNQLSFVPLQ